MSKSDPTVNPNAKSEQEKPDAGKHAEIHDHRSVESQVEGGQNQYEGEPREGYGGRGHNEGSIGGTG